MHYYPKIIHLLCIVTFWCVRAVPAAKAERKDAHGPSEKLPHFGPDSNISTMHGPTMTCGSHMHGPLRKNPTGFEDPLTFPLSPASVSHLWV